MGSFPEKGNTQTIVSRQFHVRVCIGWEETGWPWFRSVRLRFVHGRARTVPVFASDGSSLERVFCFNIVLTLPERDGSGSGC